MAGTRLCLSCRTRLAEALARLPALYQECGERHFRSRTPAWAKPPAPSRHPVAALHASAADVRRAVLGVLASWAGLTVGVTGAHPPRRTVGDLCAFLHGRLGFLVRHPAAGDFAAEMADIFARAKRVARPEEMGRVVVGPCVEAGCGGRLIARPARDRRHPSRVSCDADPTHSWSGPEWLSPGHRVDAAPTVGPTLVAESSPDAPSVPVAAPARGPRWLSPADITALWGIPRGSVYRLASEQRWERRRSAGRTYYAAEDVRRALAHTGD
ncbi:hypothetical protein [Streptomyces calidiresistens]|uniref:Uncharacterized protein n=1 Tax=Streptomyces calidiresistens TaxID=1485586 RepID=A0A7W3SZH1_9ACTN|nr:hypothetical protein [Streptomyces calidiresistens]MBB0228076.1 hypothetical protein [Streptomyces calidiresistens]